MYVCCKKQQIFFWWSECDEAWAGIVHWNYLKPLPTHHYIFIYFITCQTLPLAGKLILRKASKYNQISKVHLDFAFFCSAPRFQLCASLNWACCSCFSAWLSTFQKLRLLSETELVVSLKMVFTQVWRQSLFRGKNDRNWLISARQWWTEKICSNHRQNWWSCPSE